MNNEPSCPSPHSPADLTPYRGGYLCEGCGAFVPPTRCDIYQAIIDRAAHLLVAPPPSLEEELVALRKEVAELKAKAETRVSELGQVMTYLRNYDIKLTVNAGRNVLRVQDAKITKASIPNHSKRGITLDFVALAGEFTAELMEEQG